jgi:superfamily II DNA or RNA helicase
VRSRSELHDYQVRATEEITSRKEVMLWLGLGAGKTAIALTAIADLGIPTVVVGTKRIVEMTWPNEIAAWEHTQHLSYRAATGDKKARLRALSEMPDILGINYESLAWLLDEQLAHYRMIVFDEVSKMKAHNTQRYKAFLRHRSHFERIVGMTATPASESYVGLYAQYRTVISQPVLGRNITHFREQFVTPVFKGMYTDYKVSDRDKQAIEYAIAPHTIVLDTPRRPDPTVDDVGVEWETPAVEKQYRDAERKFVVEFEGNRHYSMASKSESFTKTRQLATGIFLLNTHAEVTSRAKIEAIKEAYEELGGEPVLVFYQFILEQQLLLDVLPGAELLSPAVLERFNLGLVPALVVHPRSCGYGLNLQGPCHHVFWSSLPTSGEEYIQANGRVNRQGQEKQVVVKRFLRAASVDLELAQLVEGKMTTMDQLINNMRGRS